MPQSKRRSRSQLLSREEARDLMRSMRTVAYIRVSSEAQAKRYGPDSQRQDLEDACMRYSLQAPAESYEDHISAAGEVVRTDFLRAIRDAQAGKFELMLFGRVDRFARRESHAWGYLDQLLELGVYVYFCDEDTCAGLDDGWEDAITQRISEAAALSRRISRNVSKAVRLRRKRGEYVGTIPQGWRRSAEKRLERDPEHSALIDRVVSLALEGAMSHPAMAEALTREGFRTKRGNFIKKPFVRDLLGNPLLYGALLVDTRTGRAGPRNPAARLLEGQCEPVISKAEFDRIQQLSSARALSRTSAHGEKHVYVLKDVLRCGEIDASSARVCDAHFGAHRQTWSARTRTYIGYRHKQQGCAADFESVRPHLSERPLLAQLDRLIARLALSEEALDLVQNYIDERSGDALAQRRAERAALENLIQRIHRSYRNGGYGDDPDEAAEAYETQLRRAKEQLAALPELATVTPMQAHVVRDLPRTWAETDVDGKRQLVRELFEAIYVIRSPEKKRGSARLTRLVLRSQYAALFAAALLEAPEFSAPAASQVQKDGRPYESDQADLLVEGLQDFRHWHAARPSVA